MRLLNDGKMLTILFVISLASTVFGAPKISPFQAPVCDKSLCKLPSCKCASTSPPEQLKLDQVPQFVFFTFDDAVQANNFEYYQELFYNKTNPDGCPVGSTYFVSHEYTDYNKVHDLYVHNQEIALHSVSHSALTTYWANISLDDLRHEFGDEKAMVSHFANIPEDAIKGMRLPFLQLSGTNSFQVAKEIGLEYDCSWPTQSFTNPGLWPYTLDYLSNQDCLIGPCPKESVPGLWVVPMLDWRDNSNVVCSMVDACVDIPDGDQEILEWYKENFNRQYKGNKAPFGFFVHAAWFLTNPNHLVAYRMFVDYLQTLEDVYLVTIDRALKWIQNPVPIGSANWPACETATDLGCSNESCGPLDKNGEDRYMNVCTNTCPDVYPWLNNPLGKAGK